VHASNILENMKEIIYSIISQAVEKIMEWNYIEGYDVNYSYIIMQDKNPSFNM
jgi:hypothetical protein